LGNRGSVKAIEKFIVIKHGGAVCEAVGTASRVGVEVVE
jgi:hypothetical protein